MSIQQQGQSGHTSEVRAKDSSRTALWLGACGIAVCLVLGTIYYIGAASRDTDQDVAPTEVREVPVAIIDPAGISVATRIRTPQGYERTRAGLDTYETYTRNLPVKAHQSPVLLYNGSHKGNQSVHAAVLDLSIGTKDLHQCADAAMRIKADFLRAAGRQADIHFDLTNGHRIDYSKWREGYRINVQGNKTEWVLEEQPSDSERVYWQYLELIFTYAGTLSLSRELEPAPLSSLSAGHLWLQGGSPGHAVLVLDECMHSASGEKLYLLAQSYMPAQEMHILINVNEPDISPWYRAPAGTTMSTPEWTFGTTDLYYFVR